MNESIEVLKAITIFKKKYPAAIINRGGVNGFGLLKEQKVISVLFPGKGIYITDKRICLTFSYRGVKYFHKYFDKLDEAFTLIDDFFVENLRMKNILKRHNHIMLAPNIEILERDIKEYIKLYWQITADNNPRIDKLGYREIFTLLKESELSKLYPFFSPYSGIMVSEFIGHFNRGTYPCLRVSKGKYIIFSNPKGEQFIDIECTLDTVYAKYRSFFPDEINWADYPQ